MSNYIVFRGLLFQNSNSDKKHNQSNQTGIYNCNSIIEYKLICRENNLTKRQEQGERLENVLFYALHRSIVVRS